MRHGFIIMLLMVLIVATLAYGWDGVQWGIR